MKKLLNNISEKDTVETSLQQAFSTAGNLEYGDVSADHFDEFQTLRHDYDSQLIYNTSTVNVFGEFNNAGQSLQHLLLRVEALAKRIVEANYS